MGAWGPGVFENDAASDFNEDIYDQGPDYIRKVIVMVVALPEQAYLDADEASMALAAIEYVAASKGKPMPGLTTLVKDWIENESYEADDDLLLYCIKAINRILNNSELKDIYSEESGEPDIGWIASVSDLKERIEMLF
jgi:hypothetical protein